MYYNTNNEDGSTLKRSKKNAINQSDIIFKLFQTNGQIDWTADEVLTVLEGIGVNWPITSIRRAITNLTNDDKLTKTNNLRPGKYGKNTYTWKLRGSND